MKMDELADRVERLEGPCRETDALIAVASGQYVSGGIRHPGMLARADTPNQLSYDPPAYTASLDAAMSLVPEGCGWTAGWGQVSPDEPMGGAVISRNAKFIGYGENYDVFAEGEAATPALALAAAALRSRGKA